jgi:glutaminyl-tRNA synthetase
MVALRVLLEKGQEKTSAAAEFIANGKADDNEILRAEAEKIN